LKAIFAPFLILLCLACEQTSNDDFRDEFVGTFDGISSTKCAALGINTTWNNTISIVKGYKSTDLFIDNLGTIGYAFLENNTYIYSQLMTGSGGNSCGTTQVVRYQGSGTLVGDSLFEVGTCVFSIYLSDYQGTWSTRSKKR